MAATFATADEDGDQVTVDFTAGTNANGYYAIIGSTVVLTAAGAAYVNAGNTLPEVDLTVRDPGNLSGTDQATPNVILVNDAPEVTLAGNTYTENARPVAVFGQLSLEDQDNNSLQGAKLTLSGVQPGDVFTSTLVKGALATSGTVGGISYSLEIAANGTLTVNLEGVASRAAYETLLESLRFATKGDNPDTTPRTFTLEVTDTGMEGVANSAQTSVVKSGQITVVAVDDPSVLGADNLTVNESSVAQGKLLANDSDPDNILSIKSVTIGNATHATDTPIDTGVGTLTVSADGKYTFTPTAHWSGEVPEVTYTTNTGSTSTLNITVTPVADAPNLSITPDNVVSTGLYKQTWTGLAGMEAGNGWGAPAAALVSAIGGADKTVAGQVVNSVVDSDVPQGVASKTSGVIYLEAGHTYSFSGSVDDSMAITLGGNLVASAALAVGLNGSFTPSVTGFYTLDAYQYNQDGAGRYEVLMSVDGGDAKLLTSDNYLIYQNIADIITPGLDVVAHIDANGEGYYAGYALNHGAEGSTIKLSTINVSLVDTDSSEKISNITVSGIPAGAVLKDASNHSFTATANNGSADVTGWDLTTLSFTPPNAHYSGTIDLTVTATSTETANHDSATSTATLTVTVVPVADAAVIAESREVSGDEDTTIALGTVATYTDNDSSETHTTVIKGIPVGATVSDGKGHSYTAVVGGDGKVDVSGWDLNNITFKAAPDASGTYTLTVSAVSTETANKAMAPSTGTIVVTVNPVTDIPTLSLIGKSTLASTDLQEVAAGGKATVAVGKLGTGEWHTDNSGNTVEIGAGTTYGAGTTSQVIELERNPNDPSNLYTTVSAQSGATYTVSFDYSARSGAESNSKINVYWGGQLITTLTANSTGMTHYTLNLPVSADGSQKLEFVAADKNSTGGVLDNIQLVETRNSGLEDQPILLSTIKAASTDADGSESLKLKISNIPEGSVLTDGTKAHTVTVGADGTVDITGWNLSSLKFTAPTNANGDYTFTVTATAQDGTAKPESVSQNLAVHVAAVNDAPEISHADSTNLGNFGNTFIETPAVGETPHEGQGAALIASDLKLTDVDSNIKAATVVLTNAHDQDSLIVTTGNTGITASVVSGVDATGKAIITLTLSGDATPAQYQAVINSIAFNNGSQDPSAETREITIKVTDTGGATVDATSQIHVVPENDAPVIQGSSVAFTEGEKAMSIVNGLSITDVDNTTLAKAVVTITGLGAGDNVAFTGTLPSGVTLVAGDVVNGTQTFTLTGTASVAQYQGLINAIQFSNATDTPVDGVRNVTVAVTDVGGSNLARDPAQTTTYSSTLKVTAVDDPTVLKADTATINEDGKATGNLLTNDIDVDNTLSISSVSVGGTTYATGTDIALAHGTLNVVADGNYTFTPTADWAGTVPTVTYTTNTGSTSTLTITVDPVVDIPVVTVGAATITSTGLNKDTWTTLSKATLGTGGNGAATSTLIDTLGKAATVNPTVHGVTSLSSTGDIAAGTATKVSGLVYLEAGKSYSFAGTGDDSLAITLGGTTVATASWGKNSGAVTSTTFTPTDTGYYTVDLYHYNQSGPGNYNVTVLVDGVATSLNSLVTFGSVQDMTAAGLDVSALHGSNGEGYYTGTSLNHGLEDAGVKLAPISVTYGDITDGSETHVTTLSGAPAGTTLTDGTTTVTFDAKGSAVVTGLNLANLTLSTPQNYNGSFVLTVTATASEQGVAAPEIRTGTLTVTVDAVDDAPVVDLTAGTGAKADITYVENAPAAQLVKQLTIVDPDGTTTLKSATVTLANAQAYDVLKAGNLPTGITASVDSSVSGKITVTLTGTASIADYLTAIKSLTFANTSDDPSTVDRSYSVVVNDGGINSVAVSGAVHVTATNDAPVSVASTASTSEDTTVALKWANFSVTDADTASSSLSIQITAPAATQGTLQYYNGTAWVPLAAGTTQLVSKASLEAGYLNFTPYKDASGTVSLTYKAYDGVDYGNASTVAITVTPVADASTLTPANITVAENGSTALNLVAGTTDIDRSETASVTKISSIPVGATVSDGVGHSFTATASVTEVNVTGWSVNTLTYTPATYHNGTDTLKVTTTSVDGTSTLNTVTDVQITVTPAVYKSTDGTIGSDTITGVAAANNIIVGDVTTIKAGQNYNIAFVVDTSGSIGSNALASMKTALSNVFDSLYANALTEKAGTIKILLVDFDTKVESIVSVNIADENALETLKDALSSMASNSGEGTNYEAGLKTASNWFLGSDVTAGAVNKTYFITDGAPNTVSTEMTNPYIYDTDYDGKGSKVSLDSLNLSKWTYGQTLTAKDGSVIVAADGTVKYKGDSGSWSWGTLLADGAGGYDVVTGTSSKSVDTQSKSAYDALIKAMGANGSVDAIGFGSSISTSTLNNYDSDHNAQKVVDATQIEDAVLGHYTAPGSDTITGSSGNDILFGDLITFDKLQGTEALKAFAGVTTDSQLHAYLTDASHLADIAKLAAGSNTYGTADGVDKLFGGEGNDILFGQGGNDILNGGGGNDILVGGNSDSIPGTDGTGNSLTGGTGADTFMFMKGDKGANIITDFNPGEGDVIDLSDLLSNHGSDLTHYLQVTQNTDGTGTLLVSSAGKLSASTNASAADVSIKVSGIGYDALKSLVAGADTHIKVDHA
ncbi:tandem-95 repeat protein [Pseudomonas japonica]|uniref:tandem-95 repeat protein n=1 Tax=Pseudomonas japonica TaxID=256466 RepID=UPI001C61561F|nr:tandem-95 repeat protein [Pseudomonas japonica]